MQRYADSFALEMKSFVESVLEDKPVKVTGMDSRIPVVMALAARKSYDEHRPVKMAEIEG
jgi:myo-inositol 2-dehydrogenase/D-chiro-inositol 1-dehydrogenase